MYYLITLHYPEADMPNVVVLAHGSDEESALKAGFRQVALEKANDRADEIIAEFEDLSIEDLKEFGFCTDTRKYRSRLTLLEVEQIESSEYQCLCKFAEKLDIYVQ